MAADRKRLRVDVRGVVQGVGFRPFVFDLATGLRLTGWVVNTSDGVTTEVQGDRAGVEAFLDRLVREAPPLAFIVEVSHEARSVEEETSFEIGPSQAANTRAALLPPDTCVCDDCLRELRDPSDRRYRYPFINCTNCGPRYTIIHDVPYDRDKTTMAGFEMCEACRREYENPRDRRFHAQPNACFACGPKVWLVDAKGHEVVTDDPIRSAAALLRGGNIVAIKGLGGFHLAVDALDADAVLRLRERKHREAKPLAIMCRDLEEASRHVHIDAASRALLTSKHRPIVLLPRRADALTAPEVAPDNPDLGVMLPYTPLHFLLLDDGPAALVMTSGNISEEPIAIGNGEALERLGPIADAMLLHDRDILVRNDDSVARASERGTTFLRRSRGYAPLPLMLRENGSPVLGVGAELKNTVCLTRGRMAFLSQHIGDQANAAAVDAFADTVARLQRIVDARPKVLGVDMHPDYATTRWAESQGLPTIAVQHHHAHVAACLAEHQHDGPAIGIAVDGTGYGTDGAVWGGEILVADLVSFRRVGHLSYVRMPGGDQAAKQPWRMAVSYLMDAYGSDWLSQGPAGIRVIPRERLRAVSQVASNEIHAPKTSSTGRLFDGIAALCGLHLEARFEAQAAMGLEMAARQAEADEGVWPVVIDEGDGMFRLPVSMFVVPAVEALARGVPIPAVAMRFHRTLARALVRACSIVREQTSIGVVAASGGSMQNRVLSQLLVQGLQDAGFRVLLPHQAPPNDGGISLGQVAVARASLHD